MRKTTVVSQVGLLFMVIVLGLFIYLQAPQLWVKQAALIAMIAVYPIWGVWHHRDRGNLNYAIAIEYILVSLLILVVLWSTLPHA